MIIRKKKDTQTFVEVRKQADSILADKKMTSQARLDIVAKHFVNIPLKEAK